MTGSDPTVRMPSVGGGAPPSGPTPSGPTPPDSTPTDPGGSDNNGGWWWVAVALVAAIAVIVVALVFVTSSDDDDNDQSSPTSSATGSTTVASTTAVTETTDVATTTTQPKPTTTASATTSTIPAPKIVTFTGPSTVDCNSLTDVEITWDADNATGVDISIDGPGIFASYAASGTELLPFACDGNPHTYLLTAHGTDGSTATRQMTITQAP